MLTNCIRWTAISILLLAALPMGNAPASQVSAQQADRFAASASLLQFTSGGHVLGFAPSKVYLASLDHALSISFVGERAITPLSGHATSAQGDQPGPLQKVTYPQVWPGIDVQYTAVSGALVKSSYSLQPGADVSQIRLGYNVPVFIESDGALVFSLENGKMRESAPIAWQETNGKKVAIEVAFAQYPIPNSPVTEIGFTIGVYDPTRPVVIDPLLTWNTFLGSISYDNGGGIAVDGGGNIYVTGESFAAWGSPIRAFAGYSDAYVAKLNSNGTLQWNTFLGGTEGDHGYGIALDSNGNVYVTGGSWATWGVPRNPHAGSADVFLAKLSGNGILQWNSFLGGTDIDGASGIALDKSGNIHVTGSSYDTWGTPLRPFAGWTDAFVAKLNNSGEMQWNTFLGGQSPDYGDDLTLDKAGNIYITGESGNGWGMPIRAFAGGDDAFVAKLNGNGVFQWNTFLGGVDWDYGHGIAVDGSGNVYVTGRSETTWDAPLNPFAGGLDVFLAKLNRDGSLQWNTFIGGASFDGGDGIEVDLSGNVYVTGYSYSNWGAPVNPHAGSADAFVATVNSSGLLQWHTFVGGTGYDWGVDITSDERGNIYVTGDSDTAWGTPLRPFVGDDVFVAAIQFADQMIRSIGTQDGWVLEQSESSNVGGYYDFGSSTFRLGDNASKFKYKTILSFNTSNLPDNAVIVSAELKIRQSGPAIGSNPFTTLGSLHVDIRRGVLGNKPTLSTLDFQAVPTAGKVATFKKTPVNGWYTASLNQTGRNNINKLGLTQLRLYFSLDDNNNQIADFMKFYSGNATAINRPVLIVEYYVP